MQKYLVIIDVSGVVARFPSSDKASPVFGLHLKLREI
jgi:hypothetical protein